MLDLSTGADLAGPGMVALSRDRIAEVRHVIGAIAWPSGEQVAEIREDGDTVRVQGEGGAERRLPLCAGFLGQD